MKGDSWEGGHRMPFIAKWPKGIEAGSVNDHLVSFADLLATFAELVDSNPIPSGSGEDSISFLAGMMGKQIPSARKTIIHDTNTIRDGDWKFINQLGSGGFSPPRRVQPEPRSRLTGQLYNLRDDIGETNNRFLEFPEIVERLKKKLDTELSR